MAPSSSILVAGGALVAASIGLAVMSYSSSSAASEEDALVSVREIDDVDDLEESGDGDYITEQDVVKIFDKLFLTLQQTLAGLMQQIQALQMQGQRIPEAQLQGLLRQEMERALVAQQASIIEAAGIDADCFEEAVWEFLEEENPKVKTAVERLQKTWLNATGEDVVGYRKGKPMTAAKSVELLSPERTIEVAEIYFSGLTDCMKNIMKQYKDDGKDLQDPVVQQQLNLDFAQAATDAGDAALATVDVSTEQFQASVQSHGANDPSVGRALAVMQQKQQMALMDLQA